MAATVRYLIVDDDEIDRMAIEGQAGKYPFFYRIGSCCNAIEAFELITRFRPDVVFADIEMPGMNGLELMQRLSGQVPALVFVTSFSEYALEGYEKEAFDYLLKPVMPERFRRCAFRLRDFFDLRTKAFAFDKDQEKDCIIVKQGYDKYKISLQDIVYLEAMKDYTRIVTPSATYLVLDTLTAMFEKLTPGKFVRIHRSYIVNREKIEAIKGNKIHLPASELPIGKLYKNVLASII